jgi:hypothetical protein
VSIRRVIVAKSACGQMNSEDKGQNAVVGKTTNSGGRSASLTFFQRMHVHSRPRPNLEESMT